MGSTNSVQPYCRFAIIDMQMMPRPSWSHLLGAIASPARGDSDISSPPPDEALPERSEPPRMCVSRANFRPASFDSRRSRRLLVYKISHIEYDRDRSFSFFARPERELLQR